MVGVGRLAAEVRGSLVLGEHQLVVAADACGGGEELFCLHLNEDIIHISDSLMN